MKIFGIIAGVIIALLVLLVVVARVAGTDYSGWVYCKHVPDTWQAVQSVYDAGQTPAQACAGLDAYNGDTWVPTSSN